MRQSFKRAGLLTVAVLLALAGTISFAGPASAVKLKNEVARSFVTQACAASTCTRDGVVINPTDPPTFVDTYCVLGNFNVTYTGPSTGRGGFVNVGAFAIPGLQFTPCDDAGFFGQVRGDRSTTLRSCSGNCVNFGTIPPGTLLRGFCELSTAPNRWFLVFKDDLLNPDPLEPRAGFVSERDLNVAPGVPDCNSPF
jgi:hypothetical protein